MKQVTLTLKFLTPCLGHIRRPDIDRFERDASGNVVFMNSWWSQLLRFASAAHGRGQPQAGRIRVDPRITGDLGVYDRHWGTSGITRHEAFLPGTEITVGMLLPDGLDYSDFMSIMDIAGHYRGMSPYGWRDGYGRFEVVNCR